MALVGLVQPDLAEGVSGHNLQLQLFSIGVHNFATHDQIGDLAIVWHDPHGTPRTAALHGFGKLQGHKARLCLAYLRVNLLIVVVVIQPRFENHDGNIEQQSFGYQ